jgi:hypothetical protein
MAIAVLNGLMLLGYQEREGNDGKVYHSALAYDQDSGENVQLDLDERPNGSAVAPGTPVEVNARVEFRRSIQQTKDGRAYVGRGTMARFRVVSMKPAKAAAPAAA